MDEQRHQNASRTGLESRRYVVLPVILLCSGALIIHKLMPGPTPNVAEQAVIVNEEIDDPLPPLEVDLIPWRDDASGEEQAAHFDSRSQGSGAVRSGPRGRVLIVRGILTIFSLGMDDLAKKMRKSGYEVKVATAAQSKNEARTLRDHVLKTKSKKPIIIIGHSLGGDLAPGLARIFAEKNVPVDVLFMLDSTMPSSPPSNVKVCVNMYQDNGTPDWARVFRGTRINNHAAQTQLINVDIRELAGRDTTARINHFNIDANPWIHKVVIGMVGQLLPGQSMQSPTQQHRTNAPLRRASQISAQPQATTDRRK